MRMKIQMTLMLSFEVPVYLKRLTKVFQRGYLKSKQNVKIDCKDVLYLSYISDDMLGLRGVSLK